MRVIETYKMPFSSLINTNVPENDAPLWSATAQYTTGNVVMHEHKLYEAIIESVPVGTDPSKDTLATAWIFLGATNLWKMMDGTLNGGTKRDTSWFVEFRMPVSLDSIALFGMNASSIRIEMWDVTNAKVYDKRISLTNPDDVIDGYTYFFAPIRLTSDLVIPLIPMYSGNRVRITFNGSSNITLGEMVFGIDRMIGETLENTTFGIKDYSLKSRDDFGAPVIVQRDYSRTTNFRFTFQTDQARRIQEMLARLRATLAVYYAGEGMDKFATTIIGFYVDFTFTLTTEISYGNLEIESVV